MIVQREIYETVVNEFGVPHTSVIGYEEIDIPDNVEEQTPADKIAELEKQLQALKETL